MNQRNWGGESLFIVYSPTSSPSLSQSKNSRKEPGSQNWSPSHGGELPKALLPEGFLRLLSYTLGTICGLMMKPAMSRVFPHKSLIKKMPQRISYRQIYLNHFLYWGGLFLSYSSLCRVIKRAAKKGYLWVILKYFRQKRQWQLL